MAKAAKNAINQELSEAMRAISLARTPSARTIAYRDFAQILSKSGQGDLFLSRVLSKIDVNSRRFGLEIAARLQPLPQLLVPSLVNLLRKSQYPGSLRIAVAANIINHLPATSPTIPKILAALERKVQPLQAVERLNRLLEQIPPHQQVIDRRNELQERSLSACPRCGVRLQQAAFIKHLWEEHQLRFDAGRVREPWQVIEDWVNQYRATKQPHFLDRSCELAQLLSPTEGVSRVHRLLKGRSTKPDEHVTLREIAAEQQASVCPNCFEIVPFQHATESTPVILAGGLLFGGNLRVEVSEGMIINWLKIEHDSKPIIDAPEPGQTLTRRGVILLFVLPLIFLATIFAFIPRIGNIPPIVPVSSLMFVAILMYIVIRMRWDHLDQPSDRAIDHTWNHFVPKLLNQAEVSTTDQLLLAGIAEASANHGDADHREETVRKALKLATETPWADATVAGLHYLLLEDREESADDVLLLADRFMDCCMGRSTWGAANRLFLKAKGDLTQQLRRSRLRILMLKSAFTAGLEPADLRGLGRLAYEVGGCYASEDIVGIARLRLLWIYRENRLWQRIGSAASVFDLAQYAQSYMQQRPDLLLLQPSTNAEQSPILICEEGIIYRESLLSSLDDRIQVRSKTGGGYDLILNNQRYTFKSNPTSLANRLKQWREFLFEEFLPRAESLEHQSSALGRKLLDRHLRLCHACKQPFYGLPGETGQLLTLLDEEVE